MKIKSKSELLICYFLFANDVKFQYEPSMNLDGEIRPDFVLEDNKGNYVILEHFGWDGEEYIRKKKEKISNYQKLCDEKENFYFIKTDEDEVLPC